MCSGIVTTRYCNMSKTNRKQTAAHLARWVAVVASEAHSVQGQRATRDQSAAHMQARSNHQSEAGQLDGARLDCYSGH